MDLNKIFVKNACPTKIGGQAVLEGIMMKGEKDTAIVIRLGNGRVHAKKTPLKEKTIWQKIPFIRGIFVFAEALVSGTRTLMYSAEVLENDPTSEYSEEEPDKLTLWLEKKFGKKGSLDVMMYVSVTIALIFSVGIFIIAPTAVVSVFKYFTHNEIVLNLIEGAFRIILFVVYVLLITRMEDIKKVFQYHGAEHKMIHCFESGLPLTVENARQFPTLHPRCGTSFLMFVMIISLLLFSFLGWPTLLVRISSRILLIPVIAGISFELLKLAGNSTGWFMKFLSYPGIALQKLTTKEPDDKQLEIAALAMKQVMV